MASEKKLEPGWYWGKEISTLFEGDIKPWYWTGGSWHTFNTLCKKLNEVEVIRALEFN